MDVAKDCKSFICTEILGNRLLTSFVFNPYKCMHGFLPAQQSHSTRISTLYYVVRNQHNIYWACSFVIIGGLFARVATTMFLYF
jgi:hypothetical protein